jgi:DnaJ-class molecular chaperone
MGPYTIHNARGKQIQLTAFFTLAMQDAAKPGHTVRDCNGDTVYSHDLDGPYQTAPEPRRERDICPWCDGTGGEPMQPCRRCNGDGDIAI